MHPNFDQDQTEITITLYKDLRAFCAQNVSVLNLVWSSVIHNEKQWATYYVFTLNNPV
jgi:hypothetical protein